MKKFRTLLVLLLTIVLTGCGNTKSLTCTAVDETVESTKNSTLRVKVKDKKIQDMRFTVDMLFPVEMQSQRQSYINEIKRTKPFIEATLIDGGIRMVTKMEDGSFIGIDAEQEITVSELREVLEIQGYTCK